MTMTKAEYYAEFTKRIPTTLKLDPVVEIELRGNTYKLELDNTAVKMILKDTSINLLGDGIRSSKLQDPVIFGSILHRSLARHHPELTIEQSDGLMEFRKFIYIRDKLLTCLELFVPDMSDLPAPPNDKEKKEKSDDPL
jgi:hypothetical protein